MNNKPSLMSRTNNDLRAHYHELCNCYACVADPLKEFLQNAVDSCTMAAESNNNYKAEIRITVDTVHRTLTVADNGIGMSADQCANALKPNVSYKRNHKNTVGNKGVGLAFLLAISNKLSIKTSNGHNGAEASVNGANDWINASDDNILEFNEFAETSDQPHGTEITIGDILEKCNEKTIYDLTLDEITFVLRSQTYIGNTYSLFDKYHLDMPIMILQVVILFLSLSVILK